MSLRPGLRAPPGSRFHGGGPVRCVEGWIMSGLNGLGPAMRIGDRSCNGTAKHFNDRQRRTSRCPQRMTLEERVTGSIPVAPTKKPKETKEITEAGKTGRRPKRILGALGKMPSRPFFCRRSTRASQARCGPSALSDAPQCSNCALSGLADGEVLPLRQP